MSNTSRRSSVTANIGENRLIITLNGVLSKKDAEAIYTDIRFCVSDLQPGFSVITDMTGCRFGHLSGIPTFRKIVDFLAEKNVGTIVRVVGCATVVFRQIERLTKANEKYEVHYVKTLQEAEEFLAQAAEDRSAA